MTTPTGRNATHWFSQYEKELLEWSGTGDLWDLHDFLTDKRRNMDRKYDYRYSKLIFVFSELIREGWLEESMLNGLDEDKIELIRKVAWFSD